MKILIFLFISIGYSTSILANTFIEVDFTQNAERIYKSGEIQAELLTIKKKYIKPGDPLCRDMQVTERYKVSRINETLTCYERLEENAKQKILNFFNNVPKSPKFKCTARIDTRVQ